ESIFVIISSIIKLWYTSTEAILLMGINGFIMGGSVVLVRERKAVGIQKNILKKIIRILFYFLRSDAGI
ncbi:MAG TPA: hypothetical protein VMY77_14780, partial [Chitinophagaceae bacterium]|nr:hypothetical protein [Chitinophagaceae bacterium]